MQEAARCRVQEIQDREEELIAVKLQIAEMALQQGLSKLQQKDDEQNCRRQTSSCFN
jgi:hypothetical protein